MPPVPAAAEIIHLFQSFASGAPIELRETHISQVFLTREFAFKRKKQVRFDFLDYSTLDNRRRQCEAEVALNSRLAADVYLARVAITRDHAGRLALDGDGEPVEYLVKMRRLPDEQRLKSRIEQDQVQPADIDRIAATLAEFYATAERPDIAPEQYVRDVWRRIEANQQELSDSAHELPQDTVRRLYRSQRRWMILHRPLLEARARQGRIIDGHGDLRTDHVYLTPQPRIIDCIEFNDDFRRIDPADELAFLAMECDGLRAGWIGARLFAAYRASSGDDPAECLIALYKCFRACVRAKVAALREEQTIGSRREANRREALELLALAESYLPAMDTVRLVVVGGISGSGKSTLAAAVADALQAVHLQTDLIRREIEAAPPHSAVDRYTPQRRQAVYDEMCRRGRQLIAAGEAVVLDGTFLTAGQRSEIAGWAAAAAVPMLTVFCDCPWEVAKQRIRQRQQQRDQPSEAYAELVDEQARQLELPTEDEQSLIVAATQSVEHNRELVLRRLSTDAAVS